MNQAHAIGTELQVTINGKTEGWVKVDEETWAVPGKPEGCDWVSWERDEIVEGIKLMNKEVTKLAPKAMTDEDAQAQYEEALDTLELWMEDLRLMDRFFPESAR